MLYTNIYSIKLKYSLLNYYYSLMFNSTLYGGAWWKPAYFVYPTDPLLVSMATKSFMVGDALIVHPVLDQGVTTFSAYFPNDLWYDFFSGSQVSLSKGYTTLTDVLPGVTNVHIRGGYIVPKLDAAGNALSTQDLRSSTITLIIASDNQITADGFMYLDDGLSLNSVTSSAYTQVIFTYRYISAQHDVLSITTPVKGYSRSPDEFPYISTLVIFGCLAEPQDIYVTQGSITNLVDVYTSFQSSTKVCTIEMEQYLPTDQMNTVVIDYFGSDFAKADREVQVRELRKL